MKNRTTARRHHNAMQRYAKERQRNLLAVAGQQEYVLVLDHLKGGFNVPKIFRSAEAFGAHEIHLVNIEPFDPAPAKGAFRKVPARFHNTFQTCYEDLTTRGYQFFALDGQCASSIHETAFPSRAAFVLGHEEIGLSFSPADYPDMRCLAIPHIGKMESLNVSIAASIIMYEYNRQHPLEPDA